MHACYFTPYTCEVCCNIDSIVGCVLYYIWLYRCWTIAKKVEDGNKILSQTQYPKLAAVVPELQLLSNGKVELHIMAPGMSPLMVPEDLPPNSPAVLR